MKRTWLVMLVPIICQGCTGLGADSPVKPKENIVVTIGPEPKATIVKKEEQTLSQQPAVAPVTKPPVSPEPVQAPKADSIPEEQQQAVDDWKKDQKNKLYQFLFENGAVPIVTEPPKLEATKLEATSNGKFAFDEKDPKSIPVTTRLEALANARLNSGRANPFDAIPEGSPFPSNSTSPKSSKGSHTINYSAGDFLALVNNEKKGMPQLHIPPPPSDLSVPGGTAVGFVPPPPPPMKASVDGLVPPPPPLVPGGSGSAGEIPVGELPQPPDKPSVVKTFTPIGRIDDRVIIAIDPQAAMANGWPRTITLGPGDQFESVRVTKVTKEAITLDDDGNEVVLHL